MKCSSTLRGCWCIQPIWYCCLQSFQIRYFVVCLFLIQNHVFFCVPATKAKWILFLNHRNRKVVRGKHNVLIHYADASAPDPSGFVLCNTFKWDILLCVQHIHFKSLKYVLCVSLHFEIPVGLQEKEYNCSTYNRSTLTS